MVSQSREEEAMKMSSSAMFAVTLLMLLPFSARSETLVEIRTQTSDCSYCGSTSGTLYMRVWSQPGPTTTTASTTTTEEWTTTTSGVSTTTWPGTTTQDTTPPTTTPRPSTTTRDTTPVTTTSEEESTTSEYLTTTLWSTADYSSGLLDGRVAAADPGYYCYATPGYAYGGDFNDGKLDVFTGSELEGCQNFDVGVVPQQRQLEIQLDYSRSNDLRFDWVELVTSDGDIFHCEVDQYVPTVYQTFTCTYTPPWGLAAVKIKTDDCSDCGMNDYYGQYSLQICDGPASGNDTVCCDTSLIDGDFYSGSKRTLSEEDLGGCQHFLIDPSDMTGGQPSDMELTLTHSGTDSGTVEWILLETFGGSFLWCDFGIELDDSEAARAPSCKAVESEAEEVLAIEVLVGSCNDCGLSYPEGYFMFRVFGESGSCETYWPWLNFPAGERVVVDGYNLGTCRDYSLGDAVTASDLRVVAIHDGFDSATLEWVQVTTSHYNAFRCPLGQELDNSESATASTCSSLVESTNSLARIETLTSDCYDCGMNNQEGDFDIQICVGSPPERCCLARDVGGTSYGYFSGPNDYDKFTESSLGECEDFHLGDVDGAEDIEITLFHHGTDSGGLDWVQIVSDQLKTYRCYFGEELDDESAMVGQNCQDLTEGEEDPAPHHYLSSLSIQTSICSDCGMDSQFGQYSLEICQQNGHDDDPCCSIKSFNSTAGYFQPGQTDTFVGDELWKCDGKDLGPISPSLEVTLFHSGTDSGTVDYVDVETSLGWVYRCDSFNELDDRQFDRDVCSLNFLP